MIRILISTLVILCSVHGLIAQTTKISGIVYDENSKQSLPFVNVFFKGSKIGVMSDADGKYNIESYYASDSLTASFIGYSPSTVKIKKGKEQFVDFYLKEKSVELSTYEIVGSKKDINPAHIILEKVIEHKDANNKKKLEAYEYEVYNKIEIDLYNIGDKFKNKLIFKPVKFIFDQIDTTEARPFLPFFITESMSDYFYRRRPRSEKEFIKATKLSGVENESMSQFVGDMYQNINPYENSMDVFGRQFISPISDFGLFTYRYYLVDSSFIENKYWCYKLTFSPKRKSELTVDGYMWINDTTYAIKEIAANMSDGANINFVKDFSFKQEYNQLEKEIWMLVKDEMLVDLKPPINPVITPEMGFFGRKTTTYQNHKINEPRPNDFYLSVDNIIVNDSARLRTDDYWIQNRHESLNEREETIYQMVDTLMKVPAFRRFADFMEVLVTGYYIRGLFEYGPYYSIYSFNKIEGSRFRFGGRTSNKFSKRLMLGGYLAYGLKDEKFKYGGSAEYFITKNPRQRIGAQYRNDIEQLGVSSNSLSQDNFFNSTLRRNPQQKLNGIEEYQSFYDLEWFDGFNTKLAFIQRSIWPLGILNFNFGTSSDSLRYSSNIKSSELSFTTRFAYKEKFLSGEFERVSLGTTYPILQINYRYGLKDVLGSHFTYHKAIASISDKVLMGPLGFMDVILEGGKVWGELPYPLLLLHTGNETFTFQENAFNLMNFYEFVSDEYVSFSATQHLNGLFLNRIPLMRKLKWREVAHLKGVTGTLSDENKMLLPNASFPTYLGKPYLEGGVGIENIFEFFRIDALWRLTYLDHPDIAKFAIRGKFYFRF